MRIAAAGPFHNLLSWLVILSLPLLHLSGLFYEDVSGRGVYVVQVQEVSGARLEQDAHCAEQMIDCSAIAIAAEGAFTGTLRDRTTR